MSDSSLIVVSKLNKSVVDATGQLQILCDIDFSLNTRETVAIVGASGSGKSTLLAIIAGLDKPTLRAKHLAFVFQSFQLLGSLTALENVMLPLELAGDSHAKKTATEMMRRVGLQDRLHHYPKVLSGGEQQRVALARAFVVSPAILLADEPTGSLDHSTGQSVLKLMMSLNKELGTALILVTHDLQLSQQCQKIWVMEQGCLSLQSH
jgi:putative ABC transport system ATP-binding protein